MFDYIPEGQISFSDYFEKQKVDIKPKALVDYINNTRTSQYFEIRNVITKTVLANGYEINSEQIDRITNNVSVWLLDVGRDYENYLKELIDGGTQ